ncbi:MAG: hypothetical protein HQL30_09595, partial [Candidatus Omnitrophica bacterium]|nr:hypothetical protein [Candidatus Omnitrophota bacterium]
MKEINLKNFRKVTGKLAEEKPWHFAGVVLVVILVVYALLSAMELLPEREPAEKRAAAGGQVFEKGDSLDWIGMKVIPVTRSIRNEFKISGKTKGMFVVNERLGLAAKYGVKTGDVIQSIG